MIVADPERSTQGDAMNSIERTQLQRDLASIETQAESFGLRFFAHLYRLDPALAAMLPGGEGQAETLQTMLDGLALGGHDAAVARQHWRELGRHHAAHGVREDHYDHLGAALLMALRDVLGQCFTAAAETTWACVWGEMAEVMIESGNTVATS